jgi:tellurite resistance protein TerC
MARRLYPITPAYHGQKFFVTENAKRMATPLLAVLIVVETTDIIFAVDSIPAIFGVTDEPFLVFTSNAFAILGLRALYFLLANMISRFEYLQIGLAAILVFIGIKMVLEALPHDFPLHYSVPIWASLGFIVLSLTTSVVVSLRVEKGADPPPPPGFDDPDAPDAPAAPPSLQDPDAPSA